MQIGRRYPQLLSRWAQPDATISRWAPYHASFEQAFPSTVPPYGTAWSFTPGHVDRATGTITYHNPHDEGSGDWGITVKCWPTIATPGITWSVMYEGPGGPYGPVAFAFNPAYYPWGLNPPLLAIATNANFYCFAKDYYGLAYP